MVGIDHFFCPECKNMLQHTTHGHVCVNDGCLSNRFIKGNFVISRRKSDNGIGRVLGKKGENYIVEFGNVEEVLHKHDLEHYYLETGTQTQTEFGSGGILKHEIVSGSPEIRYQVVFPTGIKNIREKSILEILPGSPIDKIESGKLDPPVNYYLRNKALFYKAAQTSDELKCIYNSRVDLLPHQVGVAHRAIQDYSPRYILADEVGLGKTIEAGLIISELKARGLVKRILIITPASLVTQWQYEMKNKFNEKFEIFDSNAEKVYKSNNPDENVYSLFDNILCSIHFAKRRIDELSMEFWDLIIFDEAHHVRRKKVGRKMSYTLNYRLAEALKERCNSMLLLTATPMQLDPFEFYSLVELLDPTLFKYYEFFNWYNKYLAPNVKLLIRLLESEDLTEIRNRLTQLKRVLRRVREVIPPGDGDYIDLNSLEESIENEGWRLKLIKELESYLLTNRIMIRNRKREVFKHMPKRIPKSVGIDYTPEEIALYEEITEYIRNEYNRALRENKGALGFVMVIFQKMLTSSRYTLLKSFRRRIQLLTESIQKVTNAEISEFEELDEIDQERLMEKLLAVEANKGEINRLEELCSKIEKLHHDSKLEALIQAVDNILEEDPNEKILIFTQFIGTQDYLKAELEKKYSVVVFNGKMSKEEKDESVDQFKNFAQIMISTEAGGEGRNFQFSHIMFNYDLPWNPMKLEQRIGRLDRIKQTRNVFVYNFATIDTVEQRVMDVLYERISMFKEVIGDIEPILGDLEKDVEAVIMSQKEDYEQEFKKFQKTLEERLEEAKVIQKKLEDFVMDTRPFHYETVEQILGKKPIIKSENLKEFVAIGIKLLGEDALFEEVKPDIYHIKLPYSFKRVESKKTDYNGTFNQELARENDYLDFFAFGHELINDLIRHYIGDMKQPVATIIKTEGEEGVLFNYYVEFKGLVDRSLTIPIFINSNLEYSDTLSEDYHKLVFTDNDVTDRPISFAEKIHEMESRSKEEIIRILDERLKNEQEKQDIMYEKEHKRIEDLFSFKKAKMEGELIKEKAQLEVIKGSLDEKRKRIIPALEGKISKLERRIANIEVEKNQKLQAIEEKKTVDYTFQLFSIAAFVKEGF